MALIIEDGTGVLNADSYVTVAECEAFAIAYYGASLAGSPQKKEAALRTAALFMNSLPWQGRRTFGRNQGLAWPRTGLEDGERIEDGEGNEISETEIPEEIKNAQHIFARAEFIAPGFLSPSVTITQTKTLIEVKGIKWQPRSAPNTVEAARPVVTQAIDIVEQFFKQTDIKFLLRA
jgi:hypothetical protein